LIDSDRLLSTLLELVRIDSPSREEAEIGEHLVARFEGLGLRAERDEIGNVLARMDGQGEPILLAAHMDNVMPCRGVKPVVEDGIVRSDGTTILGGDDKAGVAIIIEVVRTLLERKSPHRPLEIVITVQEEIGLFGAKALDMGALRSKMGISLDAGGGPGSVIVSAPSQDSMAAVVLGKASHAGAQPEDGISAIVIAAEAISHMHLGRIDEETTANIGTISGGTATNIIPDRVEMEGEARSRSEEKLAAQTASMVEALREAASRHGGSVEIDVDRTYDGYVLTEDDAIVRLIAGAMRSRDMEPALTATGGGSDANIFNAGGVQVVNIGIGMTQVHTTDEHIAIADVIAAAEVVLGCVALSDE